MNFGNDTRTPSSSCEPGTRKSMQKTGIRPTRLTARYRTASIVPGNRAVFRIKGGIYRLVVRIRYDKRVVYIRFIGTHAEYDRIDAKEV